MRGKIKAFLEKLDNAFAIILNLFLRKDVEPLVFIVGPPRSGTTLAYQLLNHSLGLPCITNFEAGKPYVIVARAALSRLVHRPSLASKSYTSTHGKTTGTIAPSEAGQFWYRWFKSETVEANHDKWLSPSSKTSLVSVLNALSKIKGGRAVFKNVYHSVRLEELNDAFPTSLFVIVDRPTLQVAQSILNARDKSERGRQAWWSVPIGSIDQLEVLPWADQIISQVEGVYQQINEFEKKNLQSRFFHLNYERLCESPVSVLKDLECFLLQNGVEVTRNAPDLDQIQPATGVSVETCDYRALMNSYEKYQRTRES
jgi:hypothetical protein